jgi:ATP-dependent DNA helicase RecG
MDALFLDELLRREDETVEWKESGDPRAIVATLAAFANRFGGFAEGGWVLCGVREAKDAHGFQQACRVGLDSKSLKEIRNKVRITCQKHVSPPLVPTLHEIPVSDDPARRILAFYVATSPYAHCVEEKSGAGIYYMRLDSHTVEARGELLRELLRRKGDIPPLLDRICEEALLEDVDVLAAAQFLREARLPLAPEEYLKPGVRIDAAARPLISAVKVSPEASRPVPTYLALLLFAHEPTRFLPGAYAVFSVYGGKSRDEPRSQRFEAVGPLPKLIRDLLEKLHLYTGLEIDKTESARTLHQNRRRYSEKALQEALVNAFAHRDYESPEPTRISVFSDRIEIASPGGPLPGMDLDRLLEGKSPVVWRNSALASFLLRMGLAQNEGQGIPTILSETRAVSGRDPKILPGPASFQVHLPAYEPAWSESAAEGGELRDGLVLVSIGGDSIRSTVEHSLPHFELEKADVLVDFAFPGYVRPDAWESEAGRIREKVRRWVEDPRYARIHLFYRGPVVLAPLLGALIAPAKPLVVYYYEDGRYERAYLLDRRFLRSTS